MYYQIGEEHKEFCAETVSYTHLRVHDPNRITFLDSYIGAMQRASDEGADVRGYFPVSYTHLDVYKRQR